jgi:polyisoprenoid-binding protein YceI
MKHFITIILFVFSTLFVTAQSNLTVTDANVSFIFPNNDVEGTLSGFYSSSSVDLDTIENSTFKGSVNVETISTGNSIRNWSLKRGKYFDVDNYPKITFESTSVQKQGNVIKVIGKLTIKNVSKDIDFSFERNGNRLIGKTAIYSSDYGINIKSDRDKNKVLVTLVFQVK